jgi:phospholipid/cholesterol/gamma-HCH transport system permease protein
MSEEDQSHEQGSQGHRNLWGSVAALGRLPIRYLSYLLDILGLISVALLASKDIFSDSRRPIFIELFQRQLYKTGVRSLYVISVIAMIIGVLMMSRLYSYFPKSVIEEQYAHFFVIVVVRELAPLISGIILIAMSATASTAEIGFLRVFGEFEVLNGLNINPVFFFLVPVFFAYPLSLALMMIYFDAICLLSAYISTLWSDSSVEFSSFVISVLDAIEFNEMAISLVKAMLGGMLIGVISIHYGAKAKDSFEDISEAISKSTTAQIIVFLLLNVILSLVGYSQ